MQTSRGLAVSTTSLQVINSIEHFSQQILGSGQEAANILVAAQNYPENLLIQCYAAVFNLYGQDNELTKNAMPYLAQAERLLSSANLREKLIYQAIRALQRLDYECALTVLTSVVHLFPRDTLAIKFAEWLFYCSGQAYHAKRFLSLCEQTAAANKDEPHFLAMHSFALELSGDYKQAKKIAERAIEMNLITPWAHHALGHIYLLENDIDGGLRCLQGFQPSWENILSLMKGHNSWHLALFYLAQRQEQEVLGLFNSAIFGVLPETVLEQVDAISLLWRLDMAGFPQDKLFQQLQHYLGQHPYEQYIGLNNIHYIYCLARLGDDAAVIRALNGMQAYLHTLESGSTQQRLWRDTVLPFAKAIIAFVGEAYAETTNLLAPIIAACVQMGGSDAQNDLFLQTYLLCLLKTNKQQEAKLFFDKHLAYYRNTALAEYWFTSCS